MYSHFPVHFLAAVAIITSPTEAFHADKLATLTGKYF
jgi:hypothetical protein